VKPRCLGGDLASDLTSEFCDRLEALEASVGIARGVDEDEEHVTVVGR